jgi:hypothetical protein
VSDPHRRNLGLVAGAVVAASSTLICCVLPAALVAVGAGSVLVSLVATVPQFVWLSEHKAGVFGFAALCLAVSGVALWNARRLPCPTDEQAAARCAGQRLVSARLYGIAVTMFLLGATFAFVLPLLL